MVFAVVSTHSMLMISFCCNVSGRPCASGHEDFFGGFVRDDFEDGLALALFACASCRVGVGRPFAPDDGVGRFLGGVTRLLVGAGAAFALLVSLASLASLASLPEVDGFFELPAPLPFGVGPARSRLA